MDDEERGFGSSSRVWPVAPLDEQNATVPEGSSMYLEAANDDFCFWLNVSAMREYIEPIYGWDVDVQRRYHNEWFTTNRPSISIIEDDDKTPIGVIDLSDEGDHVYLSRMAILPEARGRGIGTAAVEDLIKTRVDDPSARLHQQRRCSTLLRKARIHRRS